MPGLTPSKLYGKRVRIYRNLHNGLISIRYKNRVVGHCSSIRLEDVTFVIQKGGQARTRERGQKEVHAFVEGVVRGPRSSSFEYLPWEVRYNPYVNDTFVGKHHTGKGEWLELVSAKALHAYANERYVEMRATGLVAIDDPVDESCTV